MIEIDDPSGFQILMSVNLSSASRKSPSQSLLFLSRELKKAKIVMSKNVFPIVSRLHRAEVQGNVS